MYKRLQLVSSAALSVGHGGNDAQKVMGIIACCIGSIMVTLKMLQHALSNVGGYHWLVIRLLHWGL